VKTHEKGNAEKEKMQRALMETRNKTKGKKKAVRGKGSPPGEKKERDQQKTRKIPEKEKKNIKR